MAVAFSQDSPELRKEFNKFLNKSKRDGSYFRIVKKYYPFVPDYYPEFFEEEELK